MSMKHVLLGGLFLLAGCWVTLMGLVGTVSGSVAQRAGPATLGAFTDDGSLKAEITSIERKGFKITVTVKVTDKNGKVAGGLTQQDFEVTEDTRPVALANFTGAGQAPVRVCLVMDYSNSMKGKRIAGAKAASLALLEMLRDRTDHLGIFVFNGRTTGTELLAMGVLDPDRRKQATTAIQDTPLGLGTPMLGCMDRALSSMEGQTGRRIMIVMSDGKDTGGANAQRVIKPRVIEAAQKQNIPLYMVALEAGDNERAMRELAEPTKGQYLFAPTPEDLKGVFTKIGETLQNEYVLEYDSPNPVEDGSNRNVRISMKQGPVGTRADTQYHVPGLIATGGGARGPADSAAPASQPFLSVLLPLGSLLGMLFAVPYWLWLRPRPVSAAPVAQVVPQ